MEKEKLDEIKNSQKNLDNEYRCRTFLNNYEHWRELAQKYMLPEKQEELVKRLDDTKQTIEQANGDYSNLYFEALSAEEFKKAFDAITLAESMGANFSEEKLTTSIIKSAYMSTGRNHEDRLKSTAGYVFRNSVFVDDIKKELVDDYTKYDEEGVLNEEQHKEHVVQIMRNVEKSTKYKSEHPEIFAQLYGNKETGTSSSTPTGLGE